MAKTEQKIEQKSETFWAKWGWLLPLTVMFAFFSVSVVANAWQNASQKDYEAHLTPAERAQLVEQTKANSEAYNEGWAIFYQNIGNFLWNPMTAWTVVWLLVILRMMNRRWI